MSRVYKKRLKWRVNKIYVPLTFQMFSLLFSMPVQMLGDSSSLPVDGDSKIESFDDLKS